MFYNFYICILPLFFEKIAISIIIRKKRKLHLAMKVKIETVFRLNVHKYKKLKLYISASYNRNHIAT